LAKRIGRSTSVRLAWIRHAWQRQQLQPLVCRETAGELLRVLAYPRFRLATPITGDADSITVRAAFPGVIMTAEEFAAYEKLSRSAATRAGRKWASTDIFRPAIASDPAARQL